MNGENEGGLFQWLEEFKEMEIGSLKEEALHCYGV